MSEAGEGTNINCPWPVRRQQVAYRAMLPTLGYIKLIRTILRDDIMDDPNGFILLMQATLKAWRGPGVSPNGLYPGEAILTRPKRMSDKEYRAAKLRLVKNGLLAFHKVPLCTRCYLTRDCEKLADPQIIWGEVRGEPSSAVNPARTGCPSHQLSLMGAPRGEVEASGANQLPEKGEAKGEPKGELQLIEKSRPASDCGADRDSKGEPRGEVEGEAHAEKGRTLNNKENKNKDGSSWGGTLEVLWNEVAPTGKAERPPAPHFQRKCAEWLSKHPEETVRALIFYANANVRSKNGYLGYIDATIKSAEGIQDALDYWRAAMDRRRKAAEQSEPAKSPEELARSLALTPLRAGLYRAQNRGDQAEIERLEAAIESTLAQLGQPTPCGHGPLSGAGRGLCPSVPREGESQEPEA